MKLLLSRVGVSVALAACALLALAFAPSLTPVEAGSVPREAPELSLRTTAGKSVSLDSLKGKVVAVLWISTDCPHCQQTCESLGPIYREFAGQGLEILAMAVNPRAPANIAEFKSKHGIEFPIGVSNRSEWMRFADLSVMARAYVPYLMLVDRSGTIRYEHRGGEQEFWANQVANFREELGVLLAEQPGAPR